MSKSKSGGSQDVREVNFNTAIKKLQITSDTTNNIAQAWKKWWQQLELYLLATRLENAGEKRKIAIFNTFSIDMNDATFNEVRSQDCESGTLRESLIRDIFIANVHVDLAHVRQRLLQEENLTYERMRELARTIIVAQQDAEKMVNESTSENVMHLRHRSRSRGDSRQRAPVV
ncbi:unnamed protein product [Arctia plantaginis]|uniref:Uncharacterized protein n=1 Tax=Arctia plantaginis TaxID=874455 RepID=A0A8S0Z4E9_ARCPL|nr:unnamed protein product [Arctia plantaginis]